MAVWCQSEEVCKYTLVKVQISSLSNPFVHVLMLTTRLGSVMGGRWEVVCLADSCNHTSHSVCGSAYCLAMCSWGSSATKHFNLLHNPAVVATR
jgi:hypothetical protein